MARPAPRRDRRALRRGPLRPVFGLVSPRPRYLAAPGMGVPLPEVRGDHDEGGAGIIMNLIKLTREEVNPEAREPVWVNADRILWLRVEHIGPYDPFDPERPAYDLTYVCFDPGADAMGIMVVES